VLEDPEVRALLAELRSQGVAVGFSATGTEQADTILQAIEVGGFDTVQATWNLIERSAGDALQAAHEAGMGVIIKEALANGRLTSRGGIAPLGQAAQRLGTTEDALALAGVLARPWVDAALSGAATVEQLESNLGAVAIEWSDALEDELSALVEPPDQYWKTRSSLSWT
jgi:aryl-alcohol dehydrogenase-like predicted oxidoreductase